MYRRGWQTGLAAVLLTGGGAVWAPRPVIGQEASSGAPAEAAPEAVTTEGADYCTHLQQKIAEIEHAGADPAAPEASALSLEGARMCGHGDTRAGILRLRQALVLLMHRRPMPREQ